MTDRFNSSTGCSKCGFYASAKFDSEADCIRRTCERCGYSWMELPLDAPSHPEDGKGRNINLKA